MSLLPFTEQAARLKAESGLSFAKLAERTKELDPDGRGLSASYLAQLFNGNMPPVPRAMRLLAGAFGEHADVFVEHELHTLRQLLDPTVDFGTAIEGLARLKASNAAGEPTARWFMADRGMVTAGRRWQRRSRV